MRAVLALALALALALPGCASGPAGGWKILGGSQDYPREMSRGEPGKFDLSLEVGIIPGTEVFDGLYEAPLAKATTLTLSWNGTPLAERGTSPVLTLPLAGGDVPLSCAASASSEGRGYAASVARASGRCEIRVTLTEDLPRLEWRWGAPPAGTVQLEFHASAA